MAALISTEMTSTPFGSVNLEGRFCCWPEWAALFQQRVDRATVLIRLIGDALCTPLACRRRPDVPSVLTPTAACLSLATLSHATRDRSRPSDLDVERPLRQPPARRHARCVLFRTGDEYVLSGGRSCRWLPSTMPPARSSLIFYLPSGSYRGCVFRHSALLCVWAEVPASASASWGWRRGRRC